MTDNHELQTQALAHYQRMIDFVRAWIDRHDDIVYFKFPVLNEVRMVMRWMVQQIGESTDAGSCPYCQRYLVRHCCTACPLAGPDHTPRQCCDGLWVKMMNDSIYSTGMNLRVWLVGAEAVLAYIKTRGL